MIGYHPQNQTHPEERKLKMRAKKQKQVNKINDTGLTSYLIIVTGNMKRKEAIAQL